VASAWFLPILFNLNYIKIVPAGQILFSETQGDGSFVLETQGDGSFVLETHGDSSFVLI